MKELFLEIITPNKQVFSGNVESVTVPGTSGSFQVLFNHAPILSTFEIGALKIKESGNPPKLYATSGGTIEVLKNRILILAESVEAPEEIDVDRAKKALERAKQRLAERKKEIDRMRAELALKRAINRLKISGHLK